MKEVFVLNKPFEGSYTTKEGHVAHEIIDFFRADNGNIYIYNNPLGQCPKNIGVPSDKKEYEYNIKYMLLAKNAKMNKRDDPNKKSSFDITHVIKIKRCLHHRSTSNLDSAQKEIKNTIEKDKIAYGGVLLNDIYGTNDETLFVTFEAEEIFKAKTRVRVETPDYRFQRNKGYVHSDTEKNEFDKLNSEIDLSDDTKWENVTSQWQQVDTSKAKTGKKKTFLLNQSKANTSHKICCSYSSPFYLSYKYFFYYMAIVPHF